MERIRIPIPSRRQWLVASGVVAFAATGFGLSRWLTPHTIGVCVVTDYSYRQQRPDWSRFLETRFAAANRIFQGTGVQWSFRHADEPDPTGRLQGMEERRQKLIRTECQADIILGVTGRPESTASGDAPAFAHTAMVVDDAKQSDAHNNRVFAQALAALFGAPVDARGAGTLMTQPPEGDAIPKAAAKLISQLSEYPFGAGTAALESAWGDRAYQALVAAYADHGGNPERAAHRAIGMSLAADGSFPAAIRRLQEVVKLDPKQTAARLELAAMYSHNFQKSEAAAEYREAVRLEPDRAANHAGLAVALANAGMGEEAIDEFSTALRLDPKFAVAQAGLAYLLSQQLGRIDEAIAAYRVAVEMDPALPAATQGLDRALAFKEKSLAAAAQQRQNAQQSPASAAARWSSTPKTAGRTPISRCCCICKRITRECCGKPKRPKWPGSIHRRPWSRSQEKGPTNKKTRAARRHDFRVSPLSVTNYLNLRVFPRHSALPLSGCPGLPKNDN